MGPLQPRSSWTTIIVVRNKALGTPASFLGPVEVAIHPPWIRASPSCASRAILSVNSIFPALEFLTRTMTERKGKSVGALSCVGPSPHPRSRSRMMSLTTYDFDKSPSLHGLFQPNPCERSTLGLKYGVESVSLAPQLPSFNRQ
jgi:hypothetical protein